MARPTVRRTARIMLLSVTTLVVVGLFGAVVWQSWVTNSTTADVVRLEGDGAEMLHPMTSLLAKIVEAQSAAVRGEKVDADGLRDVLAKVGEIDAKYGVALQTHQRLTDLTAQVESVLGRGETGRAAYDAYSALATLTLDLYRRIGDSSHLIHDPDLDSYYLMDSAIVRLPDAMVLAGRASDLVTLAGGRTLVGEDAVRAAVARFGVSAAAEQVTTGLTTSVDSTARKELGTNIAERLDAFRGAADAFAPPTMLAELAVTIDASSLAANARRVSAAANPLAHLLLRELQALLDARAAKLADERRFAAGSAAFAGVTGLVMLWLLAVRPRRSPSEWKGAEGRGAEGKGAQVEGAEGRGADGNGHGVHRRDGVAVGSLTFARELLSEELAHTGRGARARHRGSGDAG